MEFLQKQGIHSCKKHVREAIERDYDTNNVGEISSFGKMLSEVTEIDSRL